MIGYRQGNEQGANLHSITLKWAMHLIADKLYGMIYQQSIFHSSHRWSSTHPSSSAMRLKPLNDLLLVPTLNPLFQSADHSWWYQLLWLIHCWWRRPQHASSLQHLSPWYINAYNDIWGWKKEQEDIRAYQCACQLASSKKNANFLLLRQAFSDDPAPCGFNSS